MSDRVQALRDAFDLAFASPPRDADGAVAEDVLAIRIGGAAHAVLVSEIHAIHPLHHVVHVPSDADSLLGVAAFRRSVLPVFDLASLLGQPRTQAKWAVLVGGNEVAALAFDSLDAHLRVPRADVSRADASRADSARSFVRGAVRTGDIVRPLIDVHSVVEALTRRAGSAPKDR